MVTVELFDVRRTDRLALALSIRREVFVGEQGVPLEEEIDAHDRTDPAAVHALASEEGVPLGAGRFYVLDPATVQIGRMAVLAEKRGGGVGAALLAALEGEAARRGFRAAHLHAQLHAAGFYRRAGYADAGPQLWDAGILHQPMEKIFRGA